LEVASLVESIKKHGQLQPIKVRPRRGTPCPMHGWEILLADGDRVEELWESGCDGCTHLWDTLYPEGEAWTAPFECVFGNRRLAAMMQIDGLTHIEVLFQELDDREARLQIWEENEQREDLDDVARGRFLSDFGQSYGLSNRALADIFGVGRSTVNSLIALLNEPPEIQSVVADRSATYGAVTKTREILGEDVEARVKVITESAAEGLSKTETIARARAIKYRQRTGRFRKSDENWHELPSVKELTDQVRQLRGWLREWKAMVVEAKLAPEAKRFVARRIRNIGKAYLAWADELEKKED